MDAGVSSAMMKNKAGNMVMANNASILSAMNDISGSIKAGKYDKNTY